MIICLGCKINYRKNPAITKWILNLIQYCEMRMVDLNFKKRSVKFILKNLGKLDKAANILVRPLIAGNSITFVCFDSYT